jgi:ligand-binding sensor domain-containing protein
MKLLVQYFFLITAISCRSFQLIAQEINVDQVELISDKQGLPSNSLYDILQDNLGYIWLTTDDGLSRYDGYSFKIFRNIEGDSSSIQCNPISDIAVDPKGNIWYGSVDGKFGYFEQATQKFVNFYWPANGLPKENWHRIFIDSKGKVWIGFWGYGLYLFDEAKRHFVHVGDLTEIPAKIKNRKYLNSISDIYEDKQGLFWLATQDGLYTFNPNTFQLKAIRNKFYPNYANDNKDDMFFSIYQDSSGFWLGTLLNGITHYNPRTNEWKNYKYAPWGKPANTIRSIIRKSENELWISTDDKGWGIFNINTDEFFFPDLHLPSFSAFSILKDRFGVVWVASQIGLFKYINSPLSFEKIKVNHSKPSNAYAVSQFYHDLKNHKLYYGTINGDGLHIRDERTGTEKVLKTKGEDPYSIGDIHDIGMDHLDTLWVIARDIVYYLDRKNEKLVKFFEAPKGKDNPYFFNVKRSITRDVWIGSGNLGLIRYNPKTKKFINYAEKEGAPVGVNGIGIEEDKYRRIWIKSTKGIYLFSYDNETFKEIHLDKNDTTSSSAEFLSEITQTPNGDIWISTLDRGIYQYQANSPEVKFVHWSIQDGLPSDVIYAITSSSDGNIWGTTPSLLFTLDPKEKKIIRSLPIYFRHDDMSLYSDDEGTIYIEAVSGFYTYNTKRDTLTESTPKLVINSIKILDKEIPVRNDLANNVINLKYDQNFVSLEYADLDFRDPSKTQYFYRMEGVDPRWVNVGNRRNVTYAGLRPGDYTFRLKAINARGITSESSTLIKLNISPPFWGTWYFKLLMVAIASSIIYFLYNLKLSRIAALAKIREKISRDLHDDMGSNLSTINILSNVAKGTVSVPGSHSEISDILNKISDLSFQAMESVDEIVWSLNPQHDSFEEIVARMRLMGGEILESQNINFMFSLEGDPARCNLAIDRRNDFYMIYKESITNITKYAKCRNVNANLAITKNQVTLIITDDGVGFDLGRINGGNGIQNIRARTKNLKGRLNIESRINTGTRIEVHIPVFPSSVNQQ